MCYEPRVDGKFIGHNGGLEPFPNHSVCFGGWFRAIVNAPNAKVTLKTISYNCPIDSTLSIGKVKFYLTTLERFLNCKIKYIICRQNVHFQIPVNEFHRFFLLTAVRYVNEFPEVINYLFKFRNLSLPKLLIKFDEALDYHKDELKDVKYGNVSAHGLKEQNLWNKEPKQICSLSKVRSKLKARESLRAQQYFF